MATVTSQAVTRHEDGQTFVGNSPMVAHAQFDAGDISGFDVLHLFEFEADTLIWEIWADITEAFTSSVTIDIGDNSDPDSWIDAADWVESNATYESSRQGSNNVYVMPHRYTAGGTIIATIGGATPAAGTCDVYILYSVGLGNI